MPELPEVETVRMGLLPVLEGHKFVKVETRRGDLRVPFPRDFAERLTGRLVKRLFSQKFPAGNFATRWDGTSGNGITVATGVYFYHLVVGNQQQVGKMSFVK